MSTDKPIFTKYYKDKYPVDVNMSLHTIIKSTNNDDKNYQFVCDNSDAIIKLIQRRNNMMKYISTQLTESLSFDVTKKSDDHITCFLKDPFFQNKSRGSIELILKRIDDKISMKRYYDPYNIHKKNIISECTENIKIDEFAHTISTSETYTQISIVFSATDKIKNKSGEKIYSMDDLIKVCQMTKTDVNVQSIASYSLSQWTTQRWIISIKFTIISIDILTSHAEKMISELLAVDTVKKQLPSVPKKVFKTTDIVNSVVSIMQKQNDHKKPKIAKVKCVDNTFEKDKEKVFGLF